jgi:hypothetical protein
MGLPCKTFGPFDPLDMIKESGVEAANAWARVCDEAKQGGKY